MVILPDDVLTVETEPAGREHEHEVVAIALKAARVGRRRARLPVSALCGAVARAVVLSIESVMAVLHAP